MWTTSSDNPQRLGSIPSSESCSIFGVTIISNLLDRLTTSLAVCTILHPPVKPWRWFPIARCQNNDVLESVTHGTGDVTVGVQEVPRGAAALGAVDGVEVVHVGDGGRPGLAG